jgi:Putative transposase/Transposase zinc-binding domain
VCHPPLDVAAAAGQPGRAGQFLTPRQRRLIAELAACRTPQLGGHIERCSACGRVGYRYHSCRNRHCPKCQGGCRAAWLDREAGYLLPVEYHHVVFTLPQAVAELAVGNPRLVYGLLFEAASAAVAELAADPKYLGAQVGLVAVLHTWGQTLCLHPHLHVLATGGGLSRDRGGRLDEVPLWRGSRPGFFLPVRALSRLFRGKFLAGLRLAHEQGRLRLPQQLQSAGKWAGWLRQQYAQDWVVYSKPPCAGPEVVLAYLARYVHRVAVGNGRLVEVSGEGVTFTYKDYRHEGKNKELTLSLGEFARRFLQHVLPAGFVRVRHYGLLSNRTREAKLRVCRRLLGEAQRQGTASWLLPVEEERCRTCPGCGKGQMEVVGLLARQAEQGQAAQSGELDST